jgi:hypothetical protein
VDVVRIYKVQDNGHDGKHKVDTTYEALQIDGPRVYSEVQKSEDLIQDSSDELHDLRGDELTAFGLDC